MRPWRLTALLLLIAGLVLVAVAPIRRMIATSVTSGPPVQLLQTDCEAVALAHPDDAEIWLGYAEIAEFAEHIPNAQLYGPPAKTTAADAFAKAEALAPGSVPIRFRYAMYLLSKAGGISRPEEEPSTSAPSPPKPRSPEQTANLCAAQDLLLALRREAPDNAAIDYSLLWTYFAQNMDADALRLARDATSKPGWTLYEAEATAARSRLCDSLSGTQAVLAGSMGFDLAFTARVRSTARVLADTGDRFRDAGNHASAIASYESIVHFGHLMRTDAYSLTEGLVGIAVTTIAADPFLLPADEYAADTATDKSDRLARLNESRVRGFCAYLREHGREDLAAYYEQEVAAYKAWNQAAKRVPDMMMEGLVNAAAGPAISSGCAVWLLTSIFLALAVILGLIAAVTRPWRNPVAGLDWTYRNWLGLLIWAALPGTVVGAFFDFRPQPMSYWWTAAVWAIPIACGIGFIGWLIRVGKGTRRRRVTMPSEDRPGKGRCFLASLRVLVPPTLAALVLASVLLLWPVANGEGRVRAWESAVAAKGEVAYWGINERAAEAANQKSALPGPTPK